MPLGGDGLAHGKKRLNNGVLTLMFEPSTSDLKASWWTVDWRMAELVNKGVLIVMFEPSTSDLGASW